MLLCTGGYGTVFYLSTNAVNSNVTAAWRAHKRGAYFANPCFTQIHPTCIPVSGDHQSKLTLMSESLRNDGRVWVPKNQGDKRPPTQIPEAERDYYLERRYPSFGNLVPRDVASRAAKAVCDEGRGVGDTGPVRCTWISPTPSSASASRPSRRATATCSTCTSGSRTRIRTRCPMRIYPAVHYTMGGLWVDYNLMSTIPGLFVLGEANFSDHGANRLGASALMQGLADGYFVAPYTVANYLAGATLPAVAVGPRRLQGGARPRRRPASTRCCQVKGKRTVRDFHRAIGTICWDHVGMARNEQGLQGAIGEIRQLRDEFWQNVLVTGEKNNLNPALDYAGRVADYMEFAELLALDALERRESCGGHFREEFQTPDGEALRKTTSIRTWPPGSSRASALDPPCTRNRWCSTKCTRRSGATSRTHSYGDDCHSEGLAAGGPHRRRAASRPTRRTTCIPTCRSSRCSTS